jgi:predicted AlkP superfamily phosphohydrolase/phosphomutase
MVSPVVWTTIATGRPHADHGIHDFFDAERRLVNSTQVKTRRIWEIAAEHAAASVGVVGWFVSWPVEPVSGFMLSDRATEWKPHERERPQSFHPPELQAPFDALVEERRSRYLDEMRRFTPLPLRADWKTALTPSDPLYARHAALDARLMRVYLRDSSFAEAGLRLSAAFAPDLLFLYLRGSDNVQHAFWFHRAPGESLAPVDEVERRLFGGVIDGYYTWLDETLGRFMAAHPRDTTFAIVSDHGFRSIVREKDGVRRSAAYHERAGVYVMSGPGFKRGLRGPDISVLDLAPLWLHGLGQPAARDMPGRVPLELLEGGGPERTRVASYGLRSEHAESRASEADDAIVEQLKALGYVE